MSSKKLPANSIPVCVTGIKSGYHTHLQIIGLLVLTLLINIGTNAQSKWVFEQYNYIRQPESAVFVPMVHFETRNNWYAELRYNYEDIQTASFFAGKTFNGGKSFSFSATPMIGYSAGRFTGVSGGLNNEVEWRNWYLCAQSQYSAATKDEATDFFFNWSELGYNFSDRFFSGLAMQFTRQEKQNYFEPGIVAGFAFRNFSFPCYVFSPFKSTCYFVVGLNYEYSLKRKGSKPQENSYLTAKL